MKSYGSADEYTDEELIFLSREGDSQAVDCLLERYKELVRGKARSMYILGGESEDLIQEGMIGLFTAIRDFDPGRDASFRTFAQLCVTRKLYSAVQSSGRQKNIPLNTAVSIYSKVRGGEGSNDPNAPELADQISDLGSTDPEKLIIDREDLKNLLNRIDSELSSFEKQVLDLYLTGLGYVEIAHVLGREEKSTDNALQRIRSKLRKQA